MKRSDFTQNQFKENLIATLRAMVVNDSLQVEFSEDVADDFVMWNQNLVQHGKVTLPLQPDRAAADMSAAYILFHDAELHRQKNYPAEEQNFFDEFEKARVVCEISHIYRGAAENIVAKKYHTAVEFDAVFRCLAPKVPDSFEELMLDLVKKTADQKAFALVVDKIIELLRQEKESSTKSAEEKEQQQKSGEDDAAKQDDLSSFGQENVDSQAPQNFSDGEETGEQQAEMPQKISELRQGDEDGKISVKVDESSAQSDKIEFKNSYKVYTTKFDEVVFPQKLVNKNELEMLRNQLDLKMNKLAGISKKMTLKLKRKLLSKRDACVEFDANGGVLNRKKLARLVIDPFVEDIWMRNRSHEYQNTCLTILLDNSGSMRGNPIVMSAMACEIIAGILEKFSVKTEIIGFTTADWKGGKARKLWESSGRPHNPGRLNELRHIIYKHFNQRFKQARINLGLMLKEGTLKENIDGEALLFARSRLMQQSEKRKILLVISDGTPVDDSTNSANDGDILSDHLHQVINRIENSARGESKLEIVGIGIGHSIEEFYRNQVTIKVLEELGDVMIEKIVDLL